MPTEFQLPRGITGFNASARVDLAQFRSAVHDLGRQHGYRVLTPPSDAPSGTLSYVRATIERRGEPLLLLLNIYGPFLGFAAVADDTVLLHDFVDRTDLAGGLARYCPLTAAVLNAAPEEANLSLLSRAERRELKYWKPQRIGDIIFNWWD